MRCPKGERFAPKYQMPTFKHSGGNIMVWGFFSLDSIGSLHRIKDIMDQNAYLDIIKNVMLCHGNDKMPRCWICQQDSSPKHCASSIK